VGGTRERGTWSKCQVIRRTAGVRDKIMEEQRDFLI